MSFIIKYKPLFEVKILHKYFLNKGIEEFMNMSEADKEKQLIGYNFSKFFHVSVSAETRRKLDGHLMVLKSTNSGFTVWTKISEVNENAPLVPVADSLEFSFLLKHNNHTFSNYTDLSFESAGKLFFFSNKRLNTEANNFPLIKKVGTNSTVSDDYILSTAGETAELKRLSVSEKKNLFGIVRICVKGNTGSLNVTNNQGEIRDPYKVFQIFFPNRETFWRYFFDEDQQVSGSDDVKKEDGNAKQLVTRSKQPLTAQGFVSIELDGIELPNPDASLIKPDSATDKIYSEIYM